MRELLKEAAEVLGAVQYYIPPADETVEMVPAITADVDACQKLAKRIDDVLAEPEPRKCPDCDGQGWTAQHSTDTNAHDGEGNCNPGYCPVQVQCEKCGGTGKITAPELDAMEIVRKIRSIEYHQTAAGLTYATHPLTDSEAAALIASYSRRVPRAMLEEIYDAGRSFEQGAVCPFISDIADKYGYRAE